MNTQLDQCLHRLICACIVWSMCVEFDLRMQFDLVHADIYFCMCTLMYTSVVIAYDICMPNLIYACEVWSRHGRIACTNICLSSMIYADAACSIHRQFDLCMQSLIYTCTVWSLYTKFHLYMCCLVCTKFNLYIHSLIYTCTFLYVKFICTSAVLNVHAWFDKCKCS